MKSTWLEQEDVGRKVVGSNPGAGKVFHLGNLRYILPTTHMDVICTKTSVQHSWEMFLDLNKEKSRVSGKVNSTKYCFSTLIQFSHKLVF